MRRLWLGHHMTVQLINKGAFWQFLYSTRFDSAWCRDKDFGGVTHNPVALGENGALVQFRRPAFVVDDLSGKFEFENMIITFILKRVPLHWHRACMTIACCFASFHSKSPHHD